MTVMSLLYIPTSYPANQNESYTTGGTGGIASRIPSDMEISVQTVGRLIANVHAITIEEEPRPQFNPIPEDVPDTNDAVLIGNPCIDGSFNSSTFDTEGSAGIATNALQNIDASQLQDTDTAVLQDIDQQNDLQDADQRNDLQDTDQQNDLQDTDQHNDLQDADQQNDPQNTEPANVLQVNSTATTLHDNVDIRPTQQDTPEPFASHILKVDDETESSASDQENATPNMNNLTVEVDGDDVVVEVYI